MKKSCKSLSCLLSLLLVIAMVVSGCGSNGSAAPAPAAESSAAVEAPAAAAATSSASTEAPAPETPNPETPVDRNVVAAVTGNIATLVTYNRATDCDIVCQDQMFDRLVYDKGDGTFEPRLAKSWEVSDDGMSITFYLNENAKWQDGEPLTAKDVVWTANLNVNPDLTTQVRSSFSVFTGTDEAGFLKEGETLGVEAVNDYEVRFDFKMPTNIDHILTMWNHEFYILPEHLLKDADVATLNSNEFWEHPIGSGAFKFESQVMGQQIDFVANPDYFLGAPEIEHLTIKAVQPSNLLSGLMSGEYDVNLVQPIPMKDWSMVESQENLVAVNNTAYTLRYIAYNCERDYLSQEVRTALDLAIDREKIVQGAYGGKGAVPLNTAVVPSHRFFCQDFAELEFDPDKAKEMLDAAGWDYNRELSLICVADDEPTAVLVQQDLAAIGVKVQIQTQDTATRYATAMAGDNDMTICNCGGNGLISAPASMISKGRMNLCHIDTPVFDEMIAEELTTTTDEGRKDLFARFQKELRDSAICSYLVSPNQLLAYNTKLTNLPVEDFTFANWKTYDWKFK